MFQLIPSRTVATLLLAAGEWRKRSYWTIFSNRVWNETTCAEFTELERKEEITLVKRSAKNVATFSLLQISKRHRVPRSSWERERKKKTLPATWNWTFGFFFSLFFPFHYLPHCGGANFYVPTARLAGIFEWRWTCRCWWRRLVNKTAGLLISLSACCICAVKTCLFTDRQASADGEVKRWRWRRGSCSVKGRAHCLFNLSRVSAAIVGVEWRRVIGRDHCRKEDGWQFGEDFRCSWNWHSASDASLYLGFQILHFILFFSLKEQI